MLAPLRRGGLDAERRFVGGGRRRATKRDGLVSTVTSTVKKDFLRGCVLNKEKETLKFHKKHHCQGQDDKRKGDVDEYVVDEEYCVNGEMIRV